MQPEDVKGGHRVLVVDDVPAVRAFLQLALAEQGYEVALAGDGRAGLQLAREFRPHLILLDWMMPRMNGAQVLRALRRDPQLRQVPVVLMTGSVGVDELVSEFGVRWVLEKPFGIADLLMALEDALAAAPAAEPPATRRGTPAISPKPDAKVAPKPDVVPRAACP